MRKYYLLTILSILLLASCIPDKHRYNYTVAVEYTNGDRDTISNRLDIWENSGFYTYSNRGDGLVLLFGRRGLVSDVVCAGVRRYKVINSTDYGRVK